MKFITLCEEVSYQKLQFLVIFTLYDLNVLLLLCFCFASKYLAVIII